MKKFREIDTFHLIKTPMIKNPTFSLRLPGCQQYILFWNLDEYHHFFNWCFLLPFWETVFLIVTFYCLDSLFSFSKKFLLENLMLYLPAECVQANQVPRLVQTSSYFLCKNSLQLPHYLQIRIQLLCCRE